jgi:hypothetical protein
MEAMFGGGIDLNKLYAVARLLAVVVAIAAAFVTVPYVATLLLVLGAIAGVGVAKEDRTRLYLVALLLVMGSKLLEGLPAPAGTYLAGIFGNLGAAYVGASVVALTLSLLASIKQDWSKAAA